MRSDAWPSPYGLARPAIRRRAAPSESRRRRLRDDALLVGADEPRHARLDALGALGLLAQHEHGLAEGRRLLLDAAGVGEDQARRRISRDELDVVERLDERHVGEARVAGATTRAHVRVGVDDVDEARRREAAPRAGRSRARPARAARRSSRAGAR